MPNNTTDKEPDQAYIFHIGDLTVPWTPSSVTISNQDRTETVYLANDEPFTIQHKDGPQQFTFEFRVTANSKKLPFMNENAEYKPKAWTDYVWELKNKKVVTRLVIERYGDRPTMDEPVILTNYSYTEDAEKDNDFIFNVTFINYHGQENQETEALEEHGLILTKNARGWNR